MDREMFELVLAAIPGVAAILTLVYNLVKYVRKAIMEKNWPVVLKMVMDLMATAEQKFTEGAEKKEWVLAMLKASADQINYPIDYEVIGKMIDDMCDMSKKVNPAPAKVEG